MNKIILITGCSSGFGMLTVARLAAGGHTIYATMRNLHKQDTLKQELAKRETECQILHLDVTDDISINKTIKYAQADEIYNLGAQSFVGASFDQPILTSNINGLGPLRVFETVKEISPHSKIYQASSSEMFGNSNEIKNEDSRMYPASPYGISKVFAHKLYYSHPRDTCLQHIEAIHAFLQLLINYL